MKVTVTAGRIPAGASDFVGAPPCAKMLQLVAERFEEGTLLYALACCMETPERIERLRYCAEGISKDQDVFSAIITSVSGFKEAATKDPAQMRCRNCQVTDGHADNCPSHPEQKRQLGLLNAFFPDPDA